MPLAHFLLGERNGDLQVRSVMLPRLAGVVHESKRYALAQRRRRLDREIRGASSVTEAIFNAGYAADQPALPADVKAHHHAQAVQVLLQPLDARLQQSAQLGGATPCATDIAIFPFVRQFAAVEPAWFDALPAKHIGLEWEPCHQMVSLIDPIPQLRKWVRKVFNVHGKDATVAWDVIRERGIRGPEETIKALQFARDAAPLAADLRTQHRSDWPGCVYYQLRATFDNADAFRAANAG